jgi:transposase InsO family protein
MAQDEGFRIKAYHSDNGNFAAADFQEHYKQQQQKFSFSGVGVKHQNGIAERNI